MAFRTFDDALRFWLGHVNYEQSPATSKDLKLDRMRELLARLDNPHREIPIVHVAGSKGKGSTSAFISSILQQSGHVTGLFTSPHLSSVRERMQIDGVPVTEDELTELLGEVRDAVRDSSEPLPVTFFEIGVAVGLLHFLRRGVDLAVIEVGLGGRFDSTNVCEPLVSVITNISFDHVQQLGRTLERIAREKAGIVKTGRPTVNGAMSAAARRVIAQICQEKRAPLRQRGVDFDYRYEPGRFTDLQCVPPRARIRCGDRESDWLELGLLGEHQAANAAVAVACADELRALGRRIPDDAVAEGLAKTQWPARLEVMEKSPLVILDCAHNVASARALIATLRSSFGLATRHKGMRVLVFACSRDKDLSGLMRVLLPHFDRVILPRQEDHPRLAPPERVAAQVNVMGHSEPMICDSVAEAWERARLKAAEDDLICVTGSVFLAGAMRPLVGSPRAPCTVPPN